MAIMGFNWIGLRIVLCLLARVSSFPGFFNWIEFSGYHMEKLCDYQPLCNPRTNHSGFHVRNANLWAEADNGGWCLYDQ